MPTTNYYTFNSAIIAEEAVGGAGYRNYGADALGSVVAIYDSSGGLQNQYRYSPYGQTALSSAAAPNPRFTWVGSLGYRQTTRHLAELYVRARHYGNLLSIWVNSDSLWPEEPRYQYARLNPVSATDFYGECASTSQGPIPADVWVGGVDTQCNCTEQYPNNTACSAGGWSYSQQQCQKQGTFLKYSYFVGWTTILGFCRSELCCADCYYPCANFNGVRCAAGPNRPDDCATISSAAFLAPMSPYRRGKLRSVDPAAKCGDPRCAPSSSWHFMWQCNLNGQPTKLVITALCCSCYAGGVESYKCLTTQGCH